MELGDAPQNGPSRRGIVHIPQHHDQILEAAASSKLQRDANVDDNVNDRILKEANLVLLKAHFERRLHNTLSIRRRRGGRGGDAAGDAIRFRKMDFPT